MSAHCKLSGILVPVAVIVLFCSTPSLARDHYLPDEIGTSESSHDVISKNQTLAYLEHSAPATATDDNSFTGGLQGLEIAPKVKQKLCKIPYYSPKFTEKSLLYLNLGPEDYIGYRALLETIIHYVLCN